MTSRYGKPFTVAAVQASPVFLNREATITKACALIAEAGARGARLVVFPEVFVAGYPDWVWAVPPSESGLLGEMYAELVASSVTIPGEDTRRLCEAARQAGAYVVIGVNERNAEGSNGSLYNSLLYVDADGRILGKHRKLIPTAPERMVWAQGAGDTLGVYDTPLGRLGGLICWENYMPLARYAMYAWGVQIYVAATWDRGEPWLSTLRHIAKEGRVYVIGCCMALRQSDIPDSFAFKQRYNSASKWINEGDTAVVNPEGEFIAGPINKCEKILYAELDPRQMSGPRWMLDVAGHYARPDVFSLTVHTEVRDMLTINPTAVSASTVPDSLGSA